MFGGRSIPLSGYLSVGGPRVEVEHADVPGAGKVGQPGQGKLATLPPPAPLLVEPLLAVPLVVEPLLAVPLVVEPLLAEPPVNEPLRVLLVLIVPELCAPPFAVP